MTRKQWLWLLILVVIGIVLTVLIINQTNRSEGSSTMSQGALPANGLQLVSQVFKDGANIPPPYTCKGQNVNPPLNIISVPEGTKSLALIMHDPDAVSGDFVHWLLWDIPTTTESITANSVPAGAMQGSNSSGSSKYMGPCPPAGTGTHRYMFELHALDSSLGLPSGSSRADLEKAMQGHILAKNTLTGLFSAE